eukprot:4244883-Amphidinium_carterae.4
MAWQLEEDVSRPAQTIENPNSENHVQYNVKACLSIVARSSMLHVISVQSVNQEDTSRAALPRFDQLGPVLARIEQVTLRVDGDQDIACCAMRFV